MSSKFYKTNESIKQRDPPNTKKLTPFDLQYLKSRGVSGPLAKFMGIKSTEKGLYFPFKRVDCWQERRWKQFRPPPWVLPEKPTSKEDGVSYVVDLVGDDKICLVEGIFDALKVGQILASAALLSFRIYPEQISQLKEWGYKKFIYFPDPELEDYLVWEQFNKLPIDSHCIRTPEYLLKQKDPSDLCMKEIKELVYPYLSNE